MQNSRRDFLKKLSTFFSLSLFPIGLNGWAAGLNDFLSPRTKSNCKRLIVLFQRGAVDGLNVVIPYTESLYYEARPTISIPFQRGQESVIDLDRHFGLHPVLNPVVSLWQNKSLAFIHACGSPNPTRSHFDAQKFMESGTPGNSITPDGWMNRLLSVMPEPHSATEALSIGPVLPFILKGKMNVANLPLGKNSAKPLPIDRPIIENAFDQLYNGNDPLSIAYREGQKARKELLADLKKEMETANNGAPLPKDFPNNATRLAQLFVQDPSIQLAFLDLGGWDTHVNQGSVKGQLANHLQPLAEGLANLAKGLGPIYQDTIVIVMSEFGRTVHENGNGGTDHGHGNVMWVLGGKVQGGKIYADWPSFFEDNLYEGRDLLVTTDFRNVIGTILQKHMDINKQQLDIIFPEMPASKLDLNPLIKI